MEMQQERRNVGEKEGGQPSRNSEETGPGPKEHRIEINEISPKVKIWIESVKNAKKRTPSQTQWPMIPKVPEMLRGVQDFKKIYEPKVISLGPYHHGKPHLHPGEMIKPIYAQKFLADGKQDMEALYIKIESKIDQVRKCYDRRPTNKYDNEALASMMLLDGCFLLQFIRSRAVDPRKDDMSDVLRKHQTNFVVQDLFLLENQLPFGVLKLIFDGANFNDGPPMEEMIQKFVTYTARTKASTSDIPLEEHFHLLHFLRTAFLGKSSKKEAEEGGDGRFCCPWKKGEQQGNWLSFRHIKELRAAGIYLKPSRTSFLTDISFNSHFFRGYLKLPPITIDDFTKPRFLNIVAYEMCPDAPNDYAFSSYICFLDSLIDNADDVQEMRYKHILYNCLGSDEEVAKIFNEIANGLVDPEAYKEVKDRIQKHYDKRLNTWIAQALHAHLSTPWTTMAFVAAVLIIFLTVLQTNYAVPGKSRLLLYIFVAVMCVFPCLVFMIRKRKKFFSSC